MFLLFNHSLDSKRLDTVENINKNRMQSSANKLCLTTTFFN